MGRCTDLVWCRRRNGSRHRGILAVSLQRRQLQEQQRVLAQRVLLERRELYAQLIEALHEWDDEMLSVLGSLISGNRTELDSPEVDRKAKTVVDINTKVQLLGSFDVLEQANRAVMERYRFWSL